MAKLNNKIKFVIPQYNFNRHWLDEIQELREQWVRVIADSERTYGDWWALADEAKELRRRVSKSIAGHRNDAKLYGEGTRSAETMNTAVEFLIPIRDEITKGLAAMRQDDRNTGKAWKDFINENPNWKSGQVGRDNMGEI